MLLRNSRIALIDFGATSFTEREYLQKFIIFVRALATRDYAKAADLCLLLTASLPSNIDIDQVKEDLMRVIRAWATRTLVKELPYHDKSMDNATIEIMKILIGYRCTMEWAWLRIHRALTTLDTSLIYLYSDVNYTRRLQRYFEKAEQRKLRAMLGPSMGWRALGSYNTALDIQDRLNEYTLFQGTLVRRHAQIFRGSMSKISAVLRAIVQLAWAAMTLAGLLGALVYFQQRGGLAADRWLGPQLSEWMRRVPRLDNASWAVLAALYGYFVMTLGKLRRRVRQRDSGTHERVAAV